jgi:structural maintenance of chromosome 2
MNMKPHEILSLLEEASGTKLYERKKDSAMKTLAKKQTKLDEIDEVGVGVLGPHCSSLCGWMEG